MAGGADEVQAAMDARVLDVTVTHCGQLLAEVRAMLVLDIFDDRIPAKFNSLTPVSHGTARQLTIPHC